VFIREADYSVNGERASVGVFRARLAKNDYRLCRQHSFRRHFERSYRFSRVFIFARPRADGRYGRRRESGSVATRRDATRKSIRQKSFPFRPAQNAGHRNVVLPVHAVASRGFEIPEIKLGLKPGKCEFEMLPPDVRGPDPPSA